MAPQSHASWITQALAALGITVGGAGVRAAIKQRELDVRLKDVEKVTGSCPSICAKTQRCVAAQDARVGSLEKGIERNYEAITALGERLDRAVVALGERIDRMVDSG